MPCTAKKTTKLIIEGGNDYIITVKGNQPRLLTQLKTIAEAQKPCERFVDIEKNRGRSTCRLVSVFANLRGIDFDWLGAKSFIQVERIGIRSGKQYLQTNYYVSSLLSKAITFAEGIRYSLGN
jgi:hypothetical protein